MLMEPVFTLCTDASNNGEDPAAEWGTRLQLRGGEWHRAAAAAPSPPRPGGRQAEVGCHVWEVFLTHSSLDDDVINTDCKGGRCDKVKAYAQSIQGKQRDNVFSLFV